VPWFATVEETAVAWACFANGWTLDQFGDAPLTRAETESVNRAVRQLRDQGYVIEVRDEGRRLMLTTRGQTWAAEQGAVLAEEKEETPC
jgi:hypothetical protein